MSSQEAPTPEGEALEKEREGRALALRLELLATVARATLAAILHVVDQRRSGFLTAEEEDKVDTVRTQVETAIGAVDEYMERQGDEAIDLSGLREKLASIVDDLDKRAMDVDVLPS